MAEAQPSSLELSAQQLAPPGPVFCNECGTRCENVHSLCMHIEYEHKHLIPKWSQFQYPPSQFGGHPPIQRPPSGGFQQYPIKPEPQFNHPEANSSFNSSSESSYSKSGPNYDERENMNFKSEQTNFDKREPNYVTSEAHGYETTDRRFIKPENNFMKEESYSLNSKPEQGYNDPPVQSPRTNSHPDFDSDFPRNNAFNRPKNGNDGEAILDLDSQRVHLYQQPPPLIRVKKSGPLKHRQPSVHQPPVEDGYDMVSTTTMTPPDSNDMSHLEEAYPEQQETNPKGGSWKSNEARRPKTYLCTACNKWFTSSGHLKRHYNTTLHKNAVKQSGQPDPCTLPVSTHHHPYRDPNFNSQTNGKVPKNSRVSNNFPTRSNGTPTPVQERLPTSETHLSQHSQQMIASPTPSSQSQSFQEQPFSPKVEAPDSSFPSPNMIKDSGYALNNNYSQDHPNLMAGPSDISEGLLAPHPPTSPYQQQIMPPTSYQATPTSIPSQNFLPLTTNYPNFQAPHVSSTQQVININLTGNQDVLGQHVDENAFIPLLMQATHSKLLALNNQDANNALIQFQKNMSQYVVMNMPQEYVGGLPSPQDLEYSTSDTNPDVSGTSFSNENPNISSSSLGNYSFQSGPTSQSEFSPDTSSFSPNCSFNNNNNNISNFSLKSKTLKPLPELILLKQESPTDENSCNIISSTDGLLSDREPLSTECKEKLPATETPTMLHCDDCKKVFNKSCYLKQHNRWFHSGEKPFRCLRCGKRFVSETMRELHALKHAGEKPHKCERCPKQFHHKTDLRRHLFSHAVDKPHTCPICHKGFIRKDHMLKHTQIHERKSSEVTSLLQMDSAVSALVS